jgi:hypothetical protein
VKPRDLGQHPHECRLGQTTRLGKDPRTPPASGVGQPAALAGDAHAHLGRPGRHVQLGEQPQQIGIGAFVVDDEPAVDAQNGAVTGRYPMGVGVPAEAGVGFEEGDPMTVPQQVGRGQTGDAGSDDGNGGTGINTHRGLRCPTSCQSFVQTIRSEASVCQMFV